MGNDVEGNRANAHLFAVGSVFSDSLLVSKIDQKRIAFARRCLYPARSTVFDQYFPSLYLRFASRYALSALQLRDSNCVGCARKLTAAASADVKFAVDFVESLRKHMQENMEYYQ